MYARKNNWSWVFRIRILLVILVQWHSFSRDSIQWLPFTWQSLVMPDSDCWDGFFCTHRTPMKHSMKHSYSPHHENMPVSFWPPWTPLLYSKTGVYRILHCFFLFLLKNIDCGYSLEPPCQDGSNKHPQSMFWAVIWKISEFFYLKIFSFRRWKVLHIWIGVFS